MDESVRVPDAVTCSKSVSQCGNIISTDSACNHLIDITISITEAMRIITGQVGKCGASSGDYRVPPLLIFSRLARGGKSTFLRLLFDALKTDGFAPIIITFNGPFVRRTGESNCDAILRLIAIQLLPDAVNKLNVVCDQDYLFDYISSHCDGKNIVLLIDELNALSVPLDADAAAMLKNYFLDRVGYYLVFTTHVHLDLDLMANVNAQVSSRGFKTVHLPISINTTELGTMSDDCKSLTPVEVAFFGGIPSLIFSVKSLHEMSPEERFDQQPIDIATLDYEDVVSHFLDEVFSGIRKSRESKFRKFDMFSSVMMDERNDTKIIWPLCYIACICKLSGGKYGIFRRLHLLIQVHFSAYMLKTESGLDWEIIVQVAIVLRMIQAQFTGSTGAFDLIDIDSCPNIVFELSMFVISCRAYGN